MKNDRITSRLRFVSAIALVALWFSPAFGFSQNHSGGAAPVSASTTPTAPSGRQDVEAAIQKLIQDLDISGRVLAYPGTPSARVSPPPSVAPGIAPLLRFRALDREARYRLGKLDLVIDDAGH
jgi:hypothetical protein